MNNLIKEHKELFKNQLLDYINDSIDTTRRIGKLTDLNTKNIIKKITPIET